MNNQSSDHIKDIITNAIKYTTNAENFTLVYGSFGSMIEKYADALGCVLIQNGKEIDEFDADLNTKTIMDILGVDEEWVNSFICGFDAFDFDASVQEAFDMGQEIRNEFNPIFFDDLENNEDSFDEPCDDPNCPCNLDKEDACNCSDCTCEDEDEDEDEDECCPNCYEEIFYCICDDVENEFEDYGEECDCPECRITYQ